MTQYMKAPFNFVPVTKNVFISDWGNQIFQDIPFEDGESGVIEIELTAITPLFIRNGHTKSDAEAKNSIYTSFSRDTNGKPFIPATSVKGMIRNVLEIISFGKMDKISNDRYSIRDLHSKKYLDYFQNSDIHCGWMTKKDSNTIEITNNGIPRRISHSELDKKWGTDFAKRFKNSPLLKADEKRTALYKIELTRNKEKKGSFIELPQNPNNPEDLRKLVKFDPNGVLKGTVVLTGQASARKDIGDLDSFGNNILKGQGKCLEFVFPDAHESLPFPLDMYEENGVYKDFCFVHKDSTDWHYWKKKMEIGEPVPVFFSIKDGEIQHFGLTYLYKLPFKKRMKDFLPPDHIKQDYDLSDCMFGKTEKLKSSKGRVQFSQLTLQSGDLSKEIRKPYMGSPKPTYYPIYLIQNGQEGFPHGEFTTMLSDSAQLKGWKRYPVHDNIAPFKIPEGMKEENLNPFFPINPGATFIGKVRFHNLKKAEIGALLKTIKLNGTGFHSLGFAKANGYGKVKIDIAEIKGLKYSIEEYIESFNELMGKNIANYSKSRELKEFFAMSIPQNTKSPLEYMELPEFVKCKKQNFKKNVSGEYLEYYSDLIVKKPIVEPFHIQVEAVITFVQKPTVKAKLLEGKDVIPKALENLPEKRKLKIGDRILVKRIMLGGNVKSLSFVKFIDQKD